MVSIIMPTYNRGYIIQKAIDSVLAQTYADWELIIVDDGSTDNTTEVVASNKDKRIRYISYSPNQGANHARNVGLSEANGEFIAFLDSDAIYEPFSLDARVSCQQQNNPDIVWTRAYFYDPEGHAHLFPQDYYSAEAMNNREEMIRISLVYGLINTSTMMFSRRCIEAGLRFDETLPRFQDWDFFWGGILNKNYKVVFLDKVTASNYYQEISISAIEEAIYEGYSHILQKFLPSFRKYGVVREALCNFFRWQISKEEYIPTIKKVLSELDKCELLDFIEDSLFDNVKKHEQIVDLHEALVKSHNLKMNKMQWRFPREKIPAGSSVVIYGAGDIGSSFVKQMAETHYCKVVLWVDIRHASMGNAVSAPKKICDYKFDYIVVAVADDDVVKGICEDLNTIGVAKEKIISL